MQFYIWWPPNHCKSVEKLQAIQWPPNCFSFTEIKLPNEKVKKYCYLVASISSPLFFYYFNNSFVHAIMIFVLTCLTKSLGRNQGIMSIEDYKNVVIGIWMLDKDVDKWGIELKMETSHIEWYFQFEKQKDLDNLKYAQE